MSPFIRLAHCRTNSKVFESLTEFQVEYDRSAEGMKRQRFREKNACEQLIPYHERNQKLQLEAVK